MAARPLPDQRIELEALFDEAKRFLESVRPLLGKYRRLRAYLAQPDGNHPGLSPDHRRAYRKKVWGEFFDGEPPERLGLELLVKYTTDEEYQALKRSAERISRADYVRGSMPPGAYDAIVEPHAPREEVYYEVAQRVVKRLYAATAEKLEQLAPRHRRKGEREERDRFAFHQDQVLQADRGETLLALRAKGWGNFNESHLRRMVKAHCRRNNLKYKSLKPGRKRGGTSGR